MFGLEVLTIRSSERNSRGVIYKRSPREHDQPEQKLGRKEVSQMYKKIITACLALAALAAFVVPTAASASPELTAPTGTTLAAGSKIIGTQIGISKLTDTSGGTLLECTTGTMSGEVTKNNGTETEGKITSALFGGTGTQAAGEPKPECTANSFFGFGNASVTAVVSEKAPWCLRATSAMAKDEFTVSGGACPGGGKIKFIMNTTGVGECEYESTGHVTGTFTTHPEDAVLTVSSSTPQTTNGFAKIRGSFACPSSGVLDMSFTLETAAGAPIYIS
jgi:hypothetical protein